MKKSVISNKEKISWWTGELFNDDILDIAIEKAYRDLMRTIRGFSNNPNHDKIFKQTKKLFKKIIISFFEIKNLNQTTFDGLHKKACEELIKLFENQMFTIGQSQKWINMTFKYLNLLNYNGIEKVYKYCHIPLDNYILNVTGYKIDKAWSKLDDYDDYLKFQEWFRKKYNNYIPLDKEFYLWLEQAKKVRKQKEY